MKNKTLLRSLIGLALSAAGCSSDAPTPAPVAAQVAMVFPMIMVWPGHSFFVWHDASEFKTMHTNILNDASRGDPILIDGTGQLFDVREMNTTKGTLWLMANPVAMSPVEFKTAPRAGGIAEARSLVAGCKYLTGGDDVRAQLSQAKTVAALVALLDGPPAPATEPTLQLDHGGIIRGDVARKELALVFTGGDYADGVPTILEVCRERNVPASFFVTGDFLRKHAAAAKSIVAAGHFLGPHSDRHLLYCDWDQRAKTLVSEADFKADLAKNLTDLKALGSEPHVFLPPFEWFNDDQVRWSAEMGLKLVNFTPGSGSNRDYIPEGDPKFTPSAKIAADVLDFEHRDAHGLNGFILLLHTGSLRTDKMSDHLDTLVGELLDRGYTFVSIEELIYPEDH